ncbi:mitochondrial carrier domain-containing protein [Pyronema omphalodes]|nr:mitochondrial carrier domain-containing protein [Pyronema omphalodes]
MSDNVLHAVAGAGGGVLSMILTYPLITLSTRSQVESKRAQTTFLDATRHIIQREGFGGLYAGLDSAVFGISVTNFVYYYWYEWSRTAFETAATKTGRNSKLTTLESMIAGAVAGSATVLMTNPIWVVNTRMTARKRNSPPAIPGSPSSDKPTLANPTPTKAATTFGEIRALFEEGGLKAFFAGVMPALVLVVNPILQYTIFEQLKNLLERKKKRNLTPTDAFWLGAIGKLVATGLTYPYITVKARMHVGGANAGEGGIIGSLRRIVKEEGWQGLYKGIGPKLMQSVITAAFLFAFKDAIFNVAKKTLQDRRRLIKAAAR